MATAETAGSEGAPDLPSIDQAFDNAVSALEGQGEVTSEDGGGPAVGDDDAGDDTTKDGEGTDDGDTGDDADGREQQTDKGEGAPAKAPETPVTTPLPEYLQGAGNEELGRLYSSLPVESRDYINKVLTPKFQEFAASRKFLEAFRTNAEEAANAVLDQIHGQRKQQAQSDEEAIAATTKLIKDELVAGGVDAAQAEVQARALAKSQHASMAPFREAEQQRAIESIAKAAEAETTRFQTEFPDCADDQPLGKRVGELMDSLVPAQGTNTYDYLKLLRTIAASEQGIADGTKKAVKKMVKGAEAAAVAKGPKAVGDGAVKPGQAGRLLTIDESIAMAERGEVVGRGINR